MVSVTFFSWQVLFFPLGAWLGEKQLWGGEWKEEWSAEEGFSCALLPAAFLLKISST